MALRDYQTSAVNDIYKSFEVNRKIILQLATGAGKTYVLSYIASQWKQGKVLILVHRQELVDQTIETLKALEVTCIETVVAKKRTVNKYANVYVAMVETAHNRIKKGLFDGIDIGLVIADECHRLDFLKVLNKFDCKILGVTATPIIQKKETFFRCKYCKSESMSQDVCCHGEVMDDWSRNISLSKYYDDIVVGVGIKDLIDRGMLERDICFIETNDNIDDLKDSNKGEDGYSDESIEKVFNDDNTMFDLLQHYKDRCVGKKTLVFNSNTKGNKLLYEKFLVEGYNVRMYDSVNSSKKEREDVVEWFENNRDAVLLNVGVFTTGFDVKDVECIILNKKN